MAEGIFTSQIKGYNVTATVDPISTNDVTDGRLVGSIWVNTSASPRRIYICTNNSAGAAVWERIDQNGIAGTSELPVGTLKELYPQMSPVLGDGWEWCDGVVISDASSPWDGYRTPNLNGATLSGIPVINIDDDSFVKTVRVSLQNIWAFAIGDAISFNVSVPNAVIRFINYSTGDITVGDSTTWTGQAFLRTSSSLVGITSVDSVGVPRYLKGSSAAGSNIDTFQGHIFRANRGTGDGGIYGYYANNSNFDSNGSLAGPFDDGTNGTPRNSLRTEPPAINVKIAIKHREL